MVQLSLLISPSRKVGTTSPPSSPRLAVTRTALNWGSSVRTKVPLACSQMPSSTSAVGITSPLRSVGMLMLASWRAAARAPSGSPTRRIAASAAASAVA